MRRTLCVGALAGVILAGIGCEPAQTSTPIQPAGQWELEQLRVQNMVLSQRLAELRQRDQALSDRLHEASLTIARQESQIDSLLQANQQGDAYKVQAQRLQAEMLQLNERILQLNELIRSVSHSRPAPTTAPAESLVPAATAPAAPAD